MQAAHAALARFTAAMRGRDYMGGYRYTDVKMLRMIASDKESGGIDGWLRHASPRSLQLRTDLLPDLSCRVSSKAAATRKLLEAALKKLMPYEKKNLGGGNWPTAAISKDAISSCGPTRVPWGPNCPTESAS